MTESYKPHEMYPPQRRAEVARILARAANRLHCKSGGLKLALKKRQELVKSSQTCLDVSGQMRIDVSAS
ncbi:hypothetical protein STSP2_01118 [Anaerohalosphaera lusitana]|uniref:Uncharacterized protein n=1 Tax=Anaerohalosphaera lusitana TaxID=1936003 RepID=A0A1U9NKB9_9BACT|nr:hypothetical protein [Anaerohalosphaera lusitana]AQT67966.1 hypothetical protein STSP2_01118 [Anaerohalosphaera lusitana]